MPVFIPLLIGGAAIYGAIKAASGVKLTVDQLCAIMPNLDPDQAAVYLPFLKSALAEAKINTPLRMAAFLAQVAHESGEFRYWTELASGQAYEGKASLGNTEPGDGVRFKGRGPIQLTGRANYTAASEALKMDLLSDPNIVATPEVGFRTTAWFWTSRGLNDWADDGSIESFREITRRINGAQNGADQREMYWQRALGVLGATSFNVA